MATTTPYFGWSVPTSTDYVKDGATAIETLGDSIDDSMKSGLNTADFLHVRDEKASGTASGSITSGAWRTHVLNTVKTNTITGASLASNQITLPAGTYFVRAESLLNALAAGQIQNYKIKLANVTDATDTAFGTGGYVYASSPSSTQVYPSLSATFTIAGTKVFELQSRVTGTSSASGYGEASTLGTEVYADVQIWKVG